MCFYRQEYWSTLAISSSRVSSQPRDWTCFSCVSWIGRQILYHWANQEALFIHISSVQFSHSVISDSLWPHGLQHATPPCPSPTPRACPKISIKLVIPSNHLILCHLFLLLSSIFLSIRVFSNESALHIRWPKIRASASASVLSMNSQDWFPLGLTGMITLQSKGL